MSLKIKLSRLKKHMNIDSDEKIGSPHKEQFTLQIPYLDKWTEMHSSPVMYEDQYAILREVRFPLMHKHGKHTFSQLQEVVEQWNQCRSSHPLSTHQKSASDLLFFDTETTGLGGGTGNTIFLLGYARLLENEVILKQFFLPGPSNEVALYHYFLEDVKEMKDLVTYNGKAFDWPQVKTRHTLIRNLLPKLPAFGHYDLLHAARRLWKDVLPSCRLSVVESEMIDFSREEDIPGYLAPMFYFDFLREQDPDIIQGVLQHNEWDICSLISLYIHISQLLLDDHKDSLSSPELMQMGRWYESYGDYFEAEYCYKHVQNRPGIDGLSAKQALANVYKKQKRLDEARILWEELTLVKHSLPLTEIYVELAKVYEHHVKDAEKAYDYARLAYDHWKKKKRLMSQTGRQNHSDYVKRMERLEKKLQSM